MNHYPHHIGDFNTATRHLSRIERSIYRDMLDMYYDTERPLDGSDMSRLARRLCCSSDDEVTAMHFVLAEFFTREGDEYVHDRCERELAAFQVRQADRHVEQDNVRTRQQRHRQRRSELFAALRAVGVVPSYKTKMPELERLHKQHCTTPLPPVSEADNAACNGTGDAWNVTGDACHPNATAIQNQNQNHISPPNPPAGGAVGGLAVATALSSHFPGHRRTRIAEVADLIAAIAAEGLATAEQLLQAAEQQAAELGKDGGKHAPNVLTWLRRQGWLDSAALPAGGGVPSDWSDSRSGIEAMGKRVGLPEWEQSGYRLLSEYEAEVRRRLATPQVPA